MQPGTRLIKTDMGRQEVAQRTGTLTPVQRRLLILVDGQKTVNDLDAYVRVGERDEALGQLLALGLVVPDGPVVLLEPAAAQGFAHPVALEPPRAATDPQVFAEVRAEAARFVHNRLGSAGEPICEAITRCRNPQELRAMLRGVEVFVGQRLDPATTQAFARHFGCLLL
ncbi:MAG: hypothetical protein ABI434_15275 [Burkholderiaceae bacterium]